MGKLARFGFVLLLFFMHRTFAYSQSIEQTFEFAKHLQAEKQYEQAIKLYNRCLFFSNDTAYFTLYMNLAVCSEESRLFDDAAKYYDLAYQNCTSDSLKNEIIFKKSLNYIQLKKFKFALIELFSLPALNYEQNLRKNFYLAICNFGLENYKNAENYFIASLDTTQLDEAKKIHSLFYERRHLYYPNPQTAYILSFILPGLGQLYCGNLEAAVNSSLLTGGLFALGVHVALRYKPIDALFSVLPWFQRYYTGGANQARKTATEKRNRNRSKTLKKIIDIR